MSDKHRVLGLRYWNEQQKAVHENIRSSHAVKCKHTKTARPSASDVTSEGFVERSTVCLLTDR